MTLIYLVLFIKHLFRLDWFGDEMMSNGWFYSLKMLWLGLGGKKSDRQP